MYSCSQNVSIMSWENNKWLFTVTWGHFMSDNGRAILLLHYHHIFLKTLKHIKSVFLYVYLQPAKDFLLWLVCFLDFWLKLTWKLILNVTVFIFPILQPKSEKQNLLMDTAVEFGWPFCQTTNRRLKHIKRTIKIWHFTFKCQGNKTGVSISQPGARLHVRASVLLITRATCTSALYCFCHRV